ncbi:MAG: hypothetical protein MK188_14780 [Gammaproteobacteria bacterium]|nr:hypothetical protein [Gammaproteobacteria bacterium]
MIFIELGSSLAKPKLRYFFTRCPGGEIGRRSAGAQVSRQAGAESDHTKQLEELPIGRTRLPNLHNILDARVVKLVDEAQERKCHVRQEPRVTTQSNSKSCR